MQLVVEFRCLSKCIEMERTCSENKHLGKFIDYDKEGYFYVENVL